MKNYLRKFNNSDYCYEKTEKIITDEHNFVLDYDITGLIYCFDDLFEYSFDWIVYENEYIYIYCNQYNVFKSKIYQKNTYVFINLCEYMER
ncbi:hypothetical protein Catovirus_1_579 [Catovirus CTV1]|uniref:Uncharacterized protein n=1 Tax=Catovirus CTV1 TaxID=1977631 RepID=A0A1V0SA08_9VIRU|nr:hypothetical protein Catovirus_1_579 [Catovirus CTV1]